MKKIRIQMTNPPAEMSLRPGAVLECPEMTARVWIRQGYAIALEEEQATKHERATKKAYLKAVYLA